TCARVRDDERQRRCLSTDDADPCVAVGGGEYQVRRRIDRIDADREARDCEHVIIILFVGVARRGMSAGEYLAGGDRIHGAGSQIQRDESLRAWRERAAAAT